MKEGPVNLQKVSSVHCSIIRFVRIRDQAMRADGLEPLQYQFLVLIGPNSNGKHPNISTLANQLGMHHHSAVELVNRLQKRGLVERRRGKSDRRHVFLHMTPLGKKLLHRLVVKEHAHAREFAPDLLKEIRILLSSRAGRAVRAET